MIAPSPQETARANRVARLVVREIAPVWHDQFAKSLTPLLPDAIEGLSVMLGAQSSVLRRELMERMDPSARLIIIEPDPGIARLAAPDMGKAQQQQIYVQNDGFESLSNLKVGTCTLVVANAIFGDQIADWNAGVTAAAPLLNPGGRMLATVLLRDSWREIEDLLADTLRGMDKREQLLGLSKLQRLRPTLTAMRTRMRETHRLSEDHFVLARREHTLLFANAKQFFASPVVVRGPLRLWRALLRGLPERTQQEVFWRLRNAIDVYFGTRPFPITLQVGTLALERPSRGATTTLRALHWSRFPTIERGDGQDTDNEPEDDLDLDIDIDVDLEEDQDVDAAVDADVELDMAVSVEGDDANAAPETDSHATITDPAQADRPKTAAQTLIDAKIIDEEDLFSEVHPDDFDPSLSLSEDLSATEDERTSDPLDEFELDFDDEDQGA